MKENLYVLQAVERERNSNQKVALATIFRVTGSAYRREGTKAAINERGQVTGILSGGCLEPDVAEVAKQVLATGTPVLKRYVLDEDLVWGLGLGCPGTVEVYIEQVPSKPAEVLAAEKQSPFEAWLKCMLEERSGVLCTIVHDVPELSLSTGDRLFVFEKGEAVGLPAEFPWRQLLVDHAIQKMNEPYSRSHMQSIVLPTGTEIPVFFDIHSPAPELVIFGAGHDAIPLVRMSTSLGIKTTVVDPRPAYNTQERFPGATCVLSGPQEYEQHITIGSRTYCLVMNHHLERDQAAISFVLKSKAPYIGVLGPRSRRDRILEALQEEGHSFSEEQLKRMHGPVGLDIGADSAEEIAVSIMAEILAVRNGHQGGFLRDKTYIHRPSAISEPTTVNIPEHPISACKLD